MLRCFPGLQILRMCVAHTQCLSACHALWRHHGSMRVPMAQGKLRGTGMNVFIMCESLYGIHRTQPRRWASVRRRSSGPAGVTASGAGLASRTGSAVGRMTPPSVRHLPRAQVHQINNAVQTTRLSPIDPAMTMLHCTLCGTHAASAPDIRSSKTCTLSDQQCLCTSDAAPCPCAAWETSLLAASGGALSEPQHPAGGSGLAGALVATVPLFAPPVAGSIRAADGTVTAATSEGSCLTGMLPPPQPWPQVCFLCLT